MNWLGPWFAPFVVLAVVAFLYLYAARGRRAGTRRTMKNDINFYLVVILATAIVSTIAGLRLEKDWLDVAAWLIAAVAVGASVWRFLVTSDDAPAIKDDKGPLERSNEKH